MWVPNRSNMTLEHQNTERCLWFRAAILTLVAKCGYGRATACSIQHHEVPDTDPPKIAEAKGTLKLNILLFNAKGIKITIKGSGIFIILFFAMYLLLNTAKKPTDA